MLLSVDLWAWYFAALLLLTIPLNWLLAALCAAVIHELCHIVAICFLGGRIHHICIGIAGAVIDAEIPDPKAELVSALAGPLGSFCLLTVCHVFPKAALCGCVQGLFNLLPVYPLDGGRVVRCAVESICPSKAEAISKWTEIFALFFLTLLAAVGAFAFSVGFLPLIFSGLMILKVILRKRPCKQR